MSDTESINYVHLMGGMISCEVPYLVLILVGYFFGRLNLLQREGLTAFAKLMIQVFIPIYYFIQVCQSTSVALLDTNFLVIISQIVAILVGGILSFLYTKIFKIDIRFRYSFVALCSFSSIRRIHYLVINTFCYHLTNKTTADTAFCNNVLYNSYPQLFFQGLIVWYVAFNLIRLDRKYIKTIKEVGENLTDKNASNILFNSSRNAEKRRGKDDGRPNGTEQ